MDGASGCVSFHICYHGNIHWGIMQTRKRFSFVLFLSILLISSSFSVPHNVSAASMHGAMDESAPVSQQTGCNQTGCTQQHGACAHHCVDQSSEQAPTSAYVPVRSHNTAHACHVSSFDLPVVPCLETTRGDTSPREPAIHTWLRSVMKRE